MRQRVTGLGTAAVVLGSVLATLLAGTPESLPAVALDSAVVLHAERVVALALASVVVAALLDRGFHGELPAEFRGVKYAERTASQELAESSGEALVALADEVHDLSQRLAAVEGQR